MKAFKVFGNPIKHSLSPFIHQYFAEISGEHELKYEKQCVDIENQCFENAVMNFFNVEQNIGLNITLPFKERAFAISKHTSLEAKYAKACNTLSIRNAEICGHNTDGLGLIADFKRQNIDLNNKNILLLGAGGASRGVLYSLCTQKPRCIYIGNRRLIKAQQLIEDAQIYLKDMLENLALNLVVEAIELDTLFNQSSTLNAFDVVINATSLGLNASNISNISNTFDDVTNINTFCLHNSYVHDNTFAYDMIYNHSSLFFTWAQQRQLNCCDGLGMLVHQAAFAFEIWNNKNISAQNIEMVLNKVRKLI